MTEPYRRVLAQAMKLSPEERLAVAEALLRSIGDRPGETGEAALGNEAGHRMDRFREGMTEPADPAASERSEDDPRKKPPST